MKPRDSTRTTMFLEAASAPAAARAGLDRNRETLARLGAALRASPPRAVVTCARGSSDHAATYAKYLVETRLGVVTASAAPSIASVYAARQDLEGCLFVAISQSGRSPDLVESARAARRGGALVVALVNAEDSPLALAADWRVPLCAGEELGVAATKSFIASLTAIAHLVLEWARDEDLAASAQRLPEDLERAWALDWSVLARRLRDARHLYVVARGVGLAVAQEAALKLKETCALHAESFSSAEVRHGPQALLEGGGVPVLVLAQHDASLQGTRAWARALAARGVEVFAAGADIPGATALPTLDAHPAIAPILLAQSFYRAANALALERGCDPDRPPNLGKVTLTT